MSLPAALLFYFSHMKIIKLCNTKKKKSSVCVMYDTLMHYYYHKAQAFINARDLFFVFSFWPLGHNQGNSFSGLCTIIIYIYIYDVQYYMDLRHYICIIILYVTHYYYSNGKYGVFFCYILLFPFFFFFATIV